MFNLYTQMNKSFTIFRGMFSMDDIFSNVYYTDFTDCIMTIQDNDIYLFFSK